MLLPNALALTLGIIIPILAAALVGGVIAGFFSAATQIDDQIIGLVGRLVCVGLLIYLGADYFSSQIVDFTKAIWGSPEYYGIIR